MKDVRDNETEKEKERRKNRRRSGRSTLEGTSSFEFFTCAQSPARKGREGLPFSCRPFYLISKPGEVARRKAIFARGLTPGGRQRGWQPFEQNCGNSEQLAIKKIREKARCIV